MEYFTEKLSQRLLRAIREFNKTPRSLFEAPKSLVDEFGLPALSVALNHLIPPIPQYNSKDITDNITNKTFTSLKELTEFIKVNYPSDIDKLFAFFAWSALNLEFNVDQQTQKQQTTIPFSIEDIFQTKKCMSHNFFPFFIEVSKLVGINPSNENDTQDDSKQKFEFYEYLTMAKSFGYNYLNPPDHPKPDHASIIIKINGEIYLCDPIWASGSMSKEKTFERKFDPSRFLIPIANTLHDHYPGTSVAKQIFPFDISYKSFINCVKLKMDSLRCESHPNLMIISPYNLLTLRFSMEGQVTDISAKAFEQNKVGDWIETEGTGIFSFQSEIGRTNSNDNKTRFKIHLTFQDGGLYKVLIFVNYVEAVTYYIEYNISESQCLPILYQNPLTKQGQVFNIVLPRNHLTVLKRKSSKLIFEVDPETHKTLSVEFYRIGRIIYNKKEKMDDQHFVCDESNFFEDLNQITKKYTLKFPHHGLYSVTFQAETSENERKEISVLFFKVEKREIESKPISSTIESPPIVIQKKTRTERAISSQGRLKYKAKEPQSDRFKPQNFEQWDCQMTEDQIEKLERKREAEIKKCKNPLIKRKMYLQNYVSPFHSKSANDEKQKSIIQRKTVQYHLGSSSMSSQHQNQRPPRSTMNRQAKSPSHERRGKSPAKK